MDKQIGPCKPSDEVQNSIVALGQGRAQKKPPAAPEGRQLASHKPKRKAKRCEQCVAAMIQGVYCHEHGCPNANKKPKDWI